MSRTVRDDLEFAKAVAEVKEVGERHRSEQAERIKRESEQLESREWCLDRRFRRYAVAADLLVHLGRGSIAVIRNGLPEDARVVNAQFDNEKGWFDLLLWSASFDPVPLGSLVPFVETPWITVE